jgi:RNA polymerase sigma factor (sigma-70 family)
MTGDVELVHAAQAGDAAALGTLLESHQARLYATALAILRDRNQAQDAVQEAFLVALLRLHELRDPNAVGAWLHSVVRNACLMRLRAHRELPGEIPESAVGHRREVDEALEQLALRDWVWTALEALPDDLRATVMLRYFCGHAAYTEIAAVLDIPLGTVRSRLNQAKRRLTDALLATATAAHHDHAALVQERWCWWRTLIEQIEHEGTAALYVADAAPDALVEAPSWGYRMRGAEDQARGMVETVAAGVRVHPTGIVTSAGVTIVEGGLENPPDDPFHCPPTHTEVRFHREGRTTHIILYYGSPASERTTSAQADAHCGAETASTKQKDAGRPSAGQEGGLGEIW